MPNRPTSWNQRKENGPWYLTACIPNIRSWPYSAKNLRCRNNVSQAEKDYSWSTKPDEYWTAMVTLHVWGPVTEDWRPLVKNLECRKGLPEVVAEDQLFSICAKVYHIKWTSQLQEWNYAINEPG